MESHPKPFLPRGVIAIEPSLAPAKAMMFLGGSYFKVYGAPSFLQPLIHAMPLYYLNDALRQVMLYGAGWSAIQTSVLVLLAWIVACMLLV